MAMNLASTLATAARIPVLCLAGEGGRQARRMVHLATRLRPVNSPRHAAILLLTGRIAPSMAPEICRIHDQLPAPRGVVLWNCHSGTDFLGGTALIKSFDSIVPTSAIEDLYGDLLAKKQASSPLFGPTENPVAWQGKGDHGQGGEGMMGGKPYGRAMAMTGEDLRDGLELGKTTMDLGPFLPWMAPGLTLSLTLQGDVIQQLKCRAIASDASDMDEIFLRATHEPVPLAEIEMARARHQLRAVADLLLVLELDDYARQALWLAEQAIAGQAEPVQKFIRRLHWTGLFLLGTRGIGSFSAAAVRGLGPLARAAGCKEDARQDDPAYHPLHFTVLVRQGGDAAAICAQRLAETVQSLELAGRAENSVREPGPGVEGPRGALEVNNGARWQHLLEKQAKGMAWDVFVSLLAAVDLDPADLPPPEDDDKDKERMDEGSHG